MYTNYYLNPSVHVPELPLQHTHSGLLNFPMSLKFTPQCQMDSNKCNKFVFRTPYKPRHTSECHIHIIYVFVIFWYTCIMDVHHVSENLQDSDLKYMVIALWVIQN